MNSIKTRSQLTSHTLNRYLPIIAFYLIAVSIRLLRNAPPFHYLLAGSDGPYFPLQVKYLVEYGRLAYPDMPLLFWLGAALSKIIHWSGIASMEQSILYAVKAIDTLIPPLAILPVYGLTNLIETKNSISKASYLIIAYTILNFTPLYIFSYQLQKNGFAMVWVMAYFYTMIAFLKDRKPKHLALALVALLLCALTHIGSFGILLAFTFIVAISKVWYSDTGKLIYNKAFLWLALMMVLLPVLIYFVDETRFYKLIGAPFKLFEAPVLLHIFNGQNFVLHGSTLIAVMANNILALMAFILLTSYRDNLKQYLYIVGMSCTLLTFLLANPMLGLEWANRLYMMSFVPISIAYIILLSSIDLRWAMKPTVCILGITLLMSFTFALYQKPVYSIDEASYDDYKNIVSKLGLKSNDAIIGRQDIRLLTNWLTPCKGLPRYRLSKNNFYEYEHVYFIKQIKGRSVYIRGEEKSCPGSCQLLYSDAFFEAYKITDTVGMQALPQAIFKGVTGKIISISNPYILVENTKNHEVRKVNVSQLKHRIDDTWKNKTVEVNGDWLPFSLTIMAKNIMIL